MDRVHFKGNPTQESSEYAELIELVQIVLNRTSVELAIVSQSKHRLTEDQFRVSVNLIHSACTVGSLLPELIRERSLRLPYAFPLARMYYERLLSAAYVISDDGSSAKRAILYAAYRVFKDQVKTLSVGGATKPISGRKKVLRKSPIVAEALDYFKDAEAIKEYEHNRQDRSRIVGAKNKRAEMLFQSVEQMGYSTASEVTHGSYLSTILFDEAPRDNTPERSFDEATTEILTMLVLSSEALGHVLSELFPDLPGPPLLIEAGRTLMKFEVPEAISLINQAYDMKL